MRDIACGSSHSAAIISNGDVYTWGLGEYGRLGHGDNTTQLRPKQVMSICLNNIDCQISLCTVAQIKLWLSKCKKKYSVANRTVAWVKSHLIIKLSFSTRVEKIPKFSAKNQL